jgi:hypothetical protein
MSSKNDSSPRMGLSKFSSRVALAVTVLLASSTSFTSTLAASKSASFTGAHVPELAHPTELLAQANANSILYFYTPNHVVHVFRDGNTIRMNVYDSTNRVTRLSQGIADNTVLNSFPSYISFGSFSGQQATYVVGITGNRNNPQARLVIRNASGQNIVDEFSSRFDAFNPPPDLVLPGQPGTGGGQQGERTLLGFETTTYAVRVFTRGGNQLMNVHNRLTNFTEVNGAAASLLPPQDPFQNAVSYVASANNINGAALYIARLTGTGGVLEIQNVNSQTITQENSVGNVTNNIPPDQLPPEFAGSPEVRSMWVAAVFGDDSTLRELRSRGYPNAAFETASPQGRFINVGAFEDRGKANELVDRLRDLGFNSRVIFRDVQYH